MMATISNSTRSIHRVAVGPVSLADLPVGKWRVLTPDEIDTVMSKMSVEEREAAELRERRKVEKKRETRKQSRGQRGEKVGRLLDRMEEKHIKELEDAANPEKSGDEHPEEEDIEDEDVLEDISERRKGPAVPGKREKPTKKIPRRKYTSL